MFKAICSLGNTVYTPGHRSGKHTVIQTPTLVRVSVWPWTGPLTNQNSGLFTGKIRLIFTFQEFCYNKK